MKVLPDELEATEHTPGQLHPDLVPQKPPQDLFSPSPPTPGLPLG